jgi:hypothetical protein
MHGWLLVWVGPLRQRYGWWVPYTKRIAPPAGQAECALGLSKATHFRQWYPVFTLAVCSVAATLIDVADVAMDLVYVKKLALCGYPRHAAWLGASTAVAVVLTVCLKALLFNL